jgi:hypothetical protein
MKDLHDQNELHDAPGLANLRKNDPFVVPEGFFEQFPQRVQQRVALSERKGLQPFTMAKWTWYGAAALTMLAIGLYFLQPPAPTGPSLSDHAAAGLNVAQEELDLDSWNDHDLYAALNEGHDQAPSMVSGLDSDEVAAYIEHEELPFDLILEEL